MHCGPAPRLPRECTIAAGYATPATWGLEAAGALRHGEQVVLTLEDTGCPPLAVLDVVARLSLTARRSAGTLTIRPADGAFTTLLELTGLAEVVAVEPLSGQV